MNRRVDLIVIVVALAACNASISVGTALDANDKDSQIQDSNTQDGTASGSDVQNGNAQNGNAQNSNVPSAQNSNVQNANATPPAGALACPGDANDAYASARIACVQAINNYRSTLGLAPYGRWCGTASCIDQQTAEDRQSQTAHSAFGTCHESAQNECPGWPTPVQDEVIQCLAQMWAEGPGTIFSQHGHYTNMSSQTYTKVECGLSVSGNSFWAAMDFH